MITLGDILELLQFWLEYKESRDLFRLIVKAMSKGAIYTVQLSHMRQAYDGP